MSLLTQHPSFQRNRGRLTAASISQLRVLFLVSAHNGLSQRALIELRELGCEVTVAVVDCAAQMEAAVAEHDPELIVCPFLKTMIPESIWSTRRCLVVHPGPVGDRGPSSLDWAIELGMPEWGVTVLQADGEFDAGEVLASRTFRVREVGKSSLYRHEVRRAAIEALREAVQRILGEDQSPVELDGAVGQARPLMRQDVRVIDWNSDPTDVVVRKIRAGEGHPGVRDTIEGVEFHLFGVHREAVLRGRPGEIVAQRAGAICRATIDGAVWITHLKGNGSFKLPAVRALQVAGIELRAPELTVSFDQPSDGTFGEISYEEHAGVGYLSFEFYNGAMSTDQCQRLRDAYLYARSRSQTKVIVLMGGSDYFSNGIHLNVIEAAENPALESWRNLSAIDDLVREIIDTDTHVVISALRGDAAAGGVPLALSADRVLAREDVVLNPYYQHMGGLYGSEYWTYLLPRRVGDQQSERLTSAPFTPIGTREAVRIGLVDDAFGANLDEFDARIRTMAEALAADAGLEHQLLEKRRQRVHDEEAKPLEAYRAQELTRSYECFFGADRSYHHARQRFVYKLGAVCTALPPAPDDLPAQSRVRPAKRQHAGAGHRRRAPQAVAAF
jgi:putative two-component system hydrogenase maturation factor HypX/HoxX